MAETHSRRDIKKAHTQQKIEDAAINAFLDRGFHGVTLEEIAESAGIHKRTLLRYFPSKADLMLWRYELGLREFMVLLETREPGVPAVKVWERHVAEQAGKLTSPDQNKIRGMIYSEEVLEAGMLRIQSKYQLALTRAILDEGGAASGNIVRAHVVAAALIGANFSIDRSTILGREPVGVEKRLLNVVAFVQKTFFGPDD
ncbi:TetR family transcriptional regulator [Haliea sp. E1-2-M8]|uniref:TetR family transcriptional regulator n=1 Tax=Haliea sp. E1-2-M8 TaxID=3064706 RepID=UPI00271CCE5A|nr:TetR family transcriptional regulator [Haliea sp. E1-2-M8]MDO8863578.1 TetR family transcriptional regulator [Haliea sp. E1-2-M8]